LGPFFDWRFFVADSNDGGNWYQKLAKSGWLGTKAQVSAEYGNPSWGSDNTQDPKSQALKKAMNKQSSPGSDVDSGPT
jgi:hypothetical protein